MKAIFLKAVKGQRYPVLLAVALMLGFGILIATSYQSLGDAQFLGEGMPRGVSAFLKAEGSLLVASGPQGYLAIGFRHPIFLVVMAALAIATASGALAREVEHRTILILLARPVPRHRLVTAKALATLLVLMGVVAAMLAGTLLGASVHGLADDIGIGSFLLVSANAFCLALAIAGYSYWISAVSSDGGRAALLATGLTVLLFFMDFVAGLFQVIEPLGLASVFHYFDPVAVSVRGTLPGLHAGVLLSVAVVGFGGALVAFQRRDIAV